MTVHFATQLYQSQTKDCLSTLVPILEHNLAQPWISAGTVFLDHCAIPVQLPGVHWIRLDRRATYADFLELAGTVNRQQARHLLFANSDLAFDHSMERVGERLTTETSVVCLTRTEQSGQAPADVAPPQSQDAWMLRTQAVDPLLLQQIAGLRLGVPGCEHLFATALVSHGYDLWNPCIDCRALHMDPEPSSYHRDKQRYWGLYAYIPECHIEEIEQKRPDVIFSFAQKPGRYFPVTVG
jgi:hypothetical protein